MLEVLLHKVDLYLLEVDAGGDPVDRYWTGYEDMSVITILLITVRCW